MIDRGNRSEEERTAAFFDRPSTEVVFDLAERVIETDPDTKDREEKPGRTVHLLIQTPEGNRELAITKAEAYLEEEARKPWNGKRLTFLQEMASGEVVAFRYRGGLQSFIKTQGGDNILILGLRDIQTGELWENSTAATKVLGLDHYETGRIILGSTNNLIFQR